MSISGCEVWPTASASRGQSISTTLPPKPSAGEARAQDLRQHPGLGHDKIQFRARVLKIHLRAVVGLKHQFAKCPHIARVQEPVGFQHPRIFLDDMRRAPRHDRIQAFGKRIIFIKRDITQGLDRMIEHRGKKSGCLFALCPAFVVDRCHLAGT